MYTYVYLCIPMYTYVYLILGSFGFFLIGEFSHL